MKIQTVGGLLLAGAFLALFLSAVISRSFAWHHDYAEAEPLVQIVWPMADEMKRFMDQYGELPADLDELARFSPNLDIKRLKNYPNQFSRNGPRRFFLKVNERFAFAIDKQFTPGWSQPTNVLGEPTNPK